MTGSHTQNRVFSRLTLAIMEDSGWYRANYSLAQRLDWGRGLGCDFVMKSCKFWMDQRRQRSQPHPRGGSVSVAVTWLRTSDVCAYVWLQTWCCGSLLRHSAGVAAAAHLSTGSAGRCRL